MMSKWCSHYFDFTEFLAVLEKNGAAKACPLYSGSFPRSKLSEN